MNVLVLDSGMGGLVILKRLMQVKPAWNYTYFMDNNYFPYGEKTKTQLQHRLWMCLSKMNSTHSIDIVILACNTATVTSIQFLRNRFPQIQFFGVVPVVHPAFLITRTKNIACLATRLCVQSESYINLMDRLEKDNNITLYNLILPKAIQLIEQHLYDGTDVVLDYLQMPVEFMVSKRVDVLILGCTHYTLVRHLIQKINQNLILEDSTEALVQHILNQSRQREAVVYTGESNIIEASMPKLISSAKLKKQTVKVIEHCIGTMLKTDEYNVPT